MGYLYPNNIRNQSCLLLICYTCFSLFLDSCTQSKANNSDYVAHLQCFKLRVWSPENENICSHQKGPNPIDSESKTEGDHQDSSRSCSQDYNT